MLSIEVRVCAGVCIALIGLAGCARHAAPLHAVASPVPAVNARAVADDSEVATQAHAPSHRLADRTGQAATEGQPALPDPRIGQAAGLAGRSLPDPSPQLVNLRRGAIAPAFDRERYLNDPAAYLDHADMARLFEPAQPAADIALIEVVGGSALAVPPGGSAPLRVRTEPGFPVTFVAVSGGAFESGLSTITVAADAQGIAQTRFTAVPGAVNACPVKASSPVRAGIVDIVVLVDATVKTGS